MKVALLASSFHPNLGGVEEVVRQLAHELQSRGSAPLKVTNRWPKDLPADEEFEGLAVRRFVFRVPERSWKQLGGALLFGHRTHRELCRQLRAFGANLIHVHCVSSNAYYALKAKRRLNLPLVVTLHSELTMDSSRLFQRSAFARGLLRRVLREADSVTAASRRTLADAEAFYGQSLVHRARVINNGSNPAEFDVALPYGHGRQYFVAMGRLVPRRASTDSCPRSRARESVRTICCWQGRDPRARD